MDFSNVVCLCGFRFDGNFNTNVSKTICCDRLSPTVNSRAFNPGRDLNSGLSDTQAKQTLQIKWQVVSCYYSLVCFIGCNHVTPDKTVNNWSKLPLASLLIKNLNDLFCLFLFSGTCHGDEIDLVEIILLLCLLFSAFYFPDKFSFFIHLFISFWNHFYSLRSNALCLTLNSCLHLYSSHTCFYRLVIKPWLCLNQSRNSIISHKNLVRLCRFGLYIQPQKNTLMLFSSLPQYMYCSSRLHEHIIENITM